MDRTLIRTRTVILLNNQLHENYEIFESISYILWVVLVLRQGRFINFFDLRMFIFIGTVLKHLVLKEGGLVVRRSPYL